MKNIFLTLLFCCISIQFNFSQTTPKFNLTKDGVSAVVLNFESGLSAYQIYTKVKSWNPALIKYPQATIRVDKENEQVKFAGHVDNGWKIRDNNFDHWYVLEYVLNVEIKDGKCRVSFETPEERYKVWFNPDGSTIPKFKDSEVSFESSINTLLTSLYNHIKGSPKKTDDSW